MCATLKLRGMPELVMASLDVEKASLMVVTICKSVMFPRDAFASSE